MQACAEEGTHYADLSGEFFFQRDMITAHHDTARHTGAKLVLAAGYDSLPFDVAAVLAYQALAKSDAGGTDEVSIMAAVTQMRGWASGGTVVSAAGMFSQVLSGEQSLSAFLDPYLLVPDAHPNCQVDSEASGWGFLPRFDSRLQQVRSSFSNPPSLSPSPSPPSFSPAPFLSISPALSRSLPRVLDREGKGRK